MIGPHQSTTQQLIIYFRKLRKSDLRRTAPVQCSSLSGSAGSPSPAQRPITTDCSSPAGPTRQRSEEHTSELQSRFDLVCRLLLEKKNTPSIQGTDVRPG